MCSAIAGPDHTPHVPGFAHLVCKDHTDPGAVVQYVVGDAWPFAGTGVRLRRKCEWCGVLTTNRMYCSTTCRKNGLYCDWQARQTEIIRRRNEGEQFKVIAKDLGISAARASAIYRTVTRASTE